MKSVTVSIRKDQGLWLEQKKNKSQSVRDALDLAIEREKGNADE